MAGYMVDATLPNAMTHEAFSEEDLARDFKFYDVLLATSHGEATDELLNIRRIHVLEWWRRTSLRQTSKTPGHCRARHEQIQKPTINRRVCLKSDALRKERQLIRDPYNVVPKVGPSDWCGTDGRSVADGWFKQQRESSFSRSLPQIDYGPGASTRPSQQNSKHVR